MAVALSLRSVVKLSSGYEIPRLGFGVAYGFGKDEDPSVLTKPCVLEALKAGYRHLDTAQVYRNEAEVGQAVKESGLDRGEIFVTSKVPSGGDPFPSVEASLNSLGFDYVDLYLIHSPPHGSKNRLDKYRSLLRAKAEGKSRSIGVSNFNVHHLEEIKDAGLELPVINQIELHPFCQQKPIVEYCRTHNIVVEAYCPVLRGAMDHPDIVNIAQKHKREPAQVLLRWSLQHDLVPLIRSSQPQRIVSNRNIYDFELDDEDMKKLDALDRGGAGAVAWNPIDVA